jgi:RNA polymerase sigma factor (sigma-70 family)
MVPVLVARGRLRAMFGVVRVPRRGWSQGWGSRELRVGMNDWGSENDDRLLVAAAVDPGAFAEFYGRYERAMLAFFVHRTREPELAADLTAEVFAAALAGVARFRPGGPPAAAWLFGIAQHKLAKSRRRGVVEDRARRRLGMPLLVLEDQDIERIESLAGGGSNVVGLFERLPAALHDAVGARVLDERSYEEIAGELRCSPAVVRKRVSRGLARLREALEEDSR